MLTWRQSLDLHQTAFHYLFSSLLKIKSIANHPDLPAEVTREIPKPELDEKEQTALHHVTSCLFNRLEVRQVMEKVVVEVCRALDLPPPEKKKGKKKGGKDKDEDDESEAEGRDKKKAADGKDAKKKERKVKEISVSDDEKPKKSKKARKEESEDEDEEMDTDAEERAFAKYASRLAPSDDDGDADSESESDRVQKGKRRSIRVRDMSISLSPEPESGSASPFGSEPELGSLSGSDPESESDADSESESEPEQPPPKQAKLSKSSKSKSKVPDQTFLPSLMGGYVSGSESSASEVDVAPRKNRLGQKQRQAIWEKKFGAGAKHMQQPPAKKQRGKGGARDDGWDLKRGAVGEEDGKGRKPWKKGIEGPLAAMGGGGGERQRPVTKKDDEGPLHPSWEARKKAKEKEQQQPRRITTRPNPVNKIVFD